MSYTSTILIVDDTWADVALLQHVLQAEDYQLVVASSGPQALAYAAELTPDLILLDVMMPGMDGIEVCCQLRANSALAEVPIILVTALDDPEWRRRGIEAGADDFVSKPIDRIELRARVRSITRLNRYRRLLSERTQRQQAEETLQRRNQALTLLNRVIATASSTLDIDQILHVACQALGQTFDRSCTEATLLSEDLRQCAVVARYPFSSQLLTDQNRGAWQQSFGWLPAFDRPISLPSIPTAEYVVAHKIPLVAVDAQVDPRLSNIHPLLRERGIVSLMTLPILMRDTIAGTLELSISEQHVFNEQEIAFAQSIAAATGQAMETIHLYQKLRRHADDLEKIVAQRTRELQAERDRTRAILEALGEAVVVANVDGAIQYVNPAMVALTGYTLEETIGQSWCRWQSDHQPANFCSQIQEIVFAGQIWRGEVVNKRKDGTIFHAALTAAPLFDSHDPGRTIGLVSVQRDITPMKEAERLKDQFVSNVSHELRTPLSVITLLCGSLDALYDTMDIHERRSMIRELRVQTRQLNDIIEDVLQISQVGSSSVPTTRRRVNLANIIHTEVGKQLTLAERKGQTIRVAGPRQLMVSGHTGQLRQVIRNLLNNAIKYTPEGGKILCECRLYCQPGSTDERPTTSAHDQRLASGRIVVRPYIRRSSDMWPGIANLGDGCWAAVRVADTGIGISQDDLSHIFERFYRVQTDENILGTGLGLSIVRELVELHDGQIAIASTPGMGSNFALYLPLLEDG